MPKSRAAYMRDYRKRHAYFNRLEGVLTVARRDHPEELRELIAMTQRGHVADIEMFWFEFVMRIEAEARAPRVTQDITDSLATIERAYSEAS